MEKKKNTSYIIIICLAVIVCVLSLSYAFYTFILNNNEITNANIHSDLPDFYLNVTNGSEVNFTISDAELYGADFDQYIEVPLSEQLNCNLEVKDGIEDGTFTCTYDLMFNYTKNPNANLGETGDFAVQLESYPDSIKYLKLYSYISNEYTYIYKTFTQTTSGACGENFKLFYVNFANKDQSYLINKNIQGIFKYGNLHCRMN